MANHPLFISNPGKPQEHRNTAENAKNPKITPETMKLQKALTTQKIMETWTTRTTPEIWKTPENSGKPEPRKLEYLKVCSARTHRAPADQG